MRLLRSFPDSQDSRAPAARAPLGDAGHARPGQRRAPRGGRAGRGGADRAGRQPRGTDAGAVRPLGAGGAPLAAPGPTPAHAPATLRQRRTLLTDSDDESRGAPAAPAAALGAGATHAQPAQPCTTAMQRQRPTRAAAAAADTSDSGGGGYGGGGGGSSDSSGGSGGGARKRTLCHAEAPGSGWLARARGEPRAQAGGAAQGSAGLRQGPGSARGRARQARRAPPPARFQDYTQVPCPSSSYSSANAQAVLHPESQAALGVCPGCVSCDAILRGVDHHARVTRSHPPS